MRLGSLFDGSGGFPLAGAMYGITPMWASEIEPYPIKVTKARFPQMKHLGSVLDVNGAEVEPVDIITFGSPCQDLSVAGKQAGLHKGERSNLFFEAIRIIKEMRKSTDGKYPRIAVWENVPGAYSSNKGEDFRAVLEAFCSIKDETADVPRPAAGKWNPAGAIVGNGWSVAWRTFDAQYWGVPQRRKRIYLIADFGSERAGEILFEQESVRGHSAESGEAGEGAAGDAKGSAGRGVVYAIDSLSSNSMKSPNPNSGFHKEEIAKCLDTSGGNPSCNQGGNVIVQQPFIVFKERAGCPGGGKGILCGDKPFTLSTLTDQAVCYAVQACGDRDNPSVSVSDTAYCLPANPMSDRGQSVCYPINTMVATRWNKDDNRTTFGIGEPGDPQFTLGAAHEHAVCYPIDLIRESRGAFETYEEDAQASGALKQSDYKGAQVVAFEPGISQRIGVRAWGDISPTLRAEAGDNKPAVCYAYDQYNGAISDKQPTLGVNCGMSTGRNGVCYRKTAHPRNADEGHGWEPTDKADMLNVFDNSESRTPMAVVESYQKVRNDNGYAKKTRCREILLGLWKAYVEKALQGSVGEQQGLQQTDILRPEVHGRALDKPTENRDKLLGESCDCESGSGCWVLRNMREAERKGCASQGRQLSEQQFGQLDADLQGLPQQATQDSGEVQGVREESQRAGILREALSKVQEIWQPTYNKNQPIQRKYIIRRLTPLEACRLQGFPDWWCDDLVTDEPTDEDMVFWREVFETHRKVIGTSSKPKTDAQIVKWLKQPRTDSAEYTMWGNGIALPNAAYVVGCAKRLMEKMEVEG